MQNRLVIFCVGMAILGAGMALGIVLGFRWGQEANADSIADQLAKQQADQEEIKEAVIDSMLRPAWKGPGMPIPRDEAEFVFESVDRRKGGKTVVLGWFLTFRNEGKMNRGLTRFWLELSRDTSGKGWKVETKRAEHYPNMFDPPGWKK